MIRLLIGENSSQMLAALQRFFDSATDIEIVGQAQESDALMRLVTALRPDVLLVDLSMTTRASAKSLASLAATCACPVIAMSFGADEPSKQIAAKFGADRLLDKTDLATDLLPAIRELARSDGRNQPKRTC